MIHELNGSLLKTYQTFSDFVELSAKLEGSRWGSDSESDGDCNFYGDATSFDDMYKRCYDGYNAKDISAKRVEIGNLVNVEDKRDSLKYSGDSLDVPTFLSGDMRCFWAEDTDKLVPKRIHITYSANCVGQVNSEMFYNHGGAIAVICDALDSIGANTKITTTFTNTSVLSGEALQVIEVKDYNESIDIPRIGVTTHPSFFRRIGFRYFESLGSYLKNKQIEDGMYGKSRTGTLRTEVVSHQEFSEWLRIDEDEIVVDLPAADLSVFKDTERTAKWVTDALEYINKMQDGHIRVWAM